MDADRRQTVTGITRADRPARYHGSTMDQRTSTNVLSHLFSRSLCRVIPGLFLGLALALGGCQRTISDGDIEPISLTELRQQLDASRNEVALVDARSAKSFAAERIPGARNLQITSVSGKDDALDPELASYGLIAVYGDDPGSAPARALVKRMLSSGYTTVKMYMGGLSEWKRAKLPTEKGPR